MNELYGSFALCRGGLIRASLRRKCHNLVKNMTAWNLSPQRRVWEVSAMGNREKLLSKVRRHLTIRDRISDERAVAVIEVD